MLRMQRSPRLQGRSARVDRNFLIRSGARRSAGLASGIRGRVSSGGVPLRILPWALGVSQLTIQPFGLCLVRRESAGEPPGHIGVRFAVLLSGAVCGVTERVRSLGGPLARTVGVEADRALIYRALDHAGGTSDLGAMLFPGWRVHGIGLCEVVRRLGSG